ncbi:MAG: FAD-dependent oxidoreductase [Aureliella sp.]
MSRLLFTKHIAGFLIAALVTNSSDARADDTANSFDVVVYGATSAGVTAAVQAKKMGKTIVIVGPDKHLGGLTAGGLGWTDSGNKNAIGGLSREFYKRVWQHYQSPSAWQWQDKSEFGNRNQSPPGKDGDRSSMWVFEPKVAEAIYEAWIKEHEIRVVREEYLDRETGVDMQEGRITEIRMLSGKRFRAKMFIDATYEGDLLAAAGVSYHVGRESNATYGEQWNGVQVGVLHHRHHFMQPTDPFIVPGDSSSGLLPLVSAADPGTKGEGDHRIQAYCFRMCLTNKPENRIAFPKPEGYDPGQYALLARVFDAGWREMFQKFDAIPNHKTDTNNHGPVSTDYIGMNYDYPEASYREREKIIEEHRRYQQGLMYFMANDPQVPEEVRRKMSQWGLAADEFTDNDNWPHQLYVREARRMIGSYVMTEHDCLDQRETPQSIGMGSYTLDSHNVQRYIKPDGTVQNEGDIGVKTPRPYKIAYGSIIPKRGECENLLVPICASSSHIAFGSIRMEPVFMILGQSAATAAAHAIDNNQAVQDVDYDKLRERLQNDGQVLELESAYSFDARKLPGIVLDDSKARKIGQWTSSSANDPYVDAGYCHNGNKASDARVIFQTQVDSSRMTVGITWPANRNRASNTKVIVHHKGGKFSTTLNQRQSPTTSKRLAFRQLGTFDFTRTATVEILAQGADGYVVADAVQFLPAGEE